LPILKGKGEKSEEMNGKAPRVQKVPRRAKRPRAKTQFKERGN